MLPRYPPLVRRRTLPTLSNLAILKLNLRSLYRNVVHRPYRQYIINGSIAGSHRHASISNRQRSEMPSARHNRCRLQGGLKALRRPRFLKDSNPTEVHGGELGVFNTVMNLSQELSGPSTLIFFKNVTREPKRVKTDLRGHLLFFECQKNLRHRRPFAGIARPTSLDDVPHTARNLVGPRKQKVSMVCYPV